MPVAFS